MLHGKIVGIFIAPKAGDPMQEVSEVTAENGNGLTGDRYIGGNGSWNKNYPGRRQVTLINACFFPGSGFTFAESRRNIVTEDIELMALIGVQFSVGTSVFRGVKYCDPCMRPSKLAGKEKSFREAFFDRGGIIAEVVVSGVVRIDDSIIEIKK